MNGDGVPDYSFEIKYAMAYESSIEYCILTPLNGAEIVSRTITRQGGADDYITLFNTGDTISETENWTTDIWTLYDEYSHQPDEWWEDEDYFVGIRIKKDEGYFYGWIRLRGNVDYEDGIIRDAAIQLQPDKSLRAGEGIESIAPIVEEVSNVADNNQWSDYKVVFYPPYIKELVSEYRIYLIKQNSDFTLADLLSLAETNYQKVDTSANYSHTVFLRNELLDLENEGLALGQEYQACIVAISADTTLFADSYSLTHSFKVVTNLPEVETPVLYDLLNYGNSTDFGVEFMRNEKEEFVKEYQILILPADSASAFTLAKALEVPVENRFKLQPTNDSLYSVQDMNIADIYGHTIMPGQFYKVCVLAVHDNISTNVSSLSQASNACSLSSPNSIYAGQSAGENLTYVDASVADISNSIDIDGNGKADIIIDVVEFTENHYSDINIVLRTADSTEVVCYNEGLVMNISLFSTINNNYDWSSGEFQLYYKNGGYGAYTTTGEFVYGKGMLAFRKVSSSETIFGWMKLGWESRVLEYAYQLSAVMSVPEVETHLDFKVYPNPGNGSTMQLDIVDFEIGIDYKVDILSESGLLKKSINLSEKKSTIDLNNLGSGIYYVRFKSPSEQSTQKIIVL
nr:T9SS type A sorting domain-containing protein [uncultured Draconibacterium sp.]